MITLPKLTPPLIRIADMLERALTGALDKSAREGALNMTISLRTMNKLGWWVAIGAIVVATALSGAQSVAAQDNSIPAGASTNGALA
ncbi:MAG TPA: hypothetical protein PL074_09085, partial [Thermoflexales bacterium]|nr:hypothetical protein [Thermoflexales bacterium]